MADSAVWKYPLEMKDLQHINIPVNAEILSVQVQQGVPTVWALVDPEGAEVDFAFRMVGTGHPIGYGIAHFTFLGTFQLQRIMDSVWHVWWCT